MRKILLLFICSLFIPTLTPAESPPESFQSMGLARISEPIETWYSPGYKRHAISTGGLLKDAEEFYRNSFNLRRSFSLAIVDSDTWEKITPIPIGLPFVSGPPYVICLPAGANHELFRLVQSAVQTTTLENTFGLPHEQMVNKFITLIGFHELGHIYTKEYGLHLPYKWMEEWVAMYFAYAYLRKMTPESARLWVEVSAILVQNLGSMQTSLEVFEEQYFRVGIANYTWYQTVFLLHVEEVFLHQGMEMPEKIKSIDWCGHSITQTIESLEAIAPGFHQWMGTYELMPK